MTGALFANDYSCTRRNFAHSAQTEAGLIETAPCRNHNVLASIYDTLSNYSRCSTKKTTVVLLQNRVLSDIINFGNSLELFSDHRLHIVRIKI